MLAAAITWTFGLSGAVALSVVAVLGYLFGRSQNREAPVNADRHSEIDRAARIAKQLESIADGLRQDLALHRGQVEKFKGQLRQAEGAPGDQAWERLKQDAEAMVGPTLQLVSQLSTAYEQIRQQSQALANFTGGRTDPMTGLANCRSLDEQLAGLLKAREKGSGEFSVAVVGLDPPPAGGGSEQNQQRLQRVSKMLSAGLRGDDFAARYGVDEVVVVLPATRLSGAGVFAGRLRQNAQEQLGESLCCGLAESMPGDSAKSLLARADSAAYSARAAGGGQQFLHTGATIRPDTRLQPAAVAANDSAPAEPSPAPPASTPALPALAGPEVAGSLLASPAD